MGGVGAKNNMNKNIGYMDLSTIYAFTLVFLKLLRTIHIHGFKLDKA